MTITIKTIEDFINRINKLKKQCSDIKGFQLNNPLKIQETLYEYLYNNINNVYNNPLCDSDYFEKIIDILLDLNVRQIRHIINNYIINNLQDDPSKNKEQLIKLIIEGYIYYVYPERVFYNIRKNKPLNNTSSYEFNWKK